MIRDHRNGTAQVNEEWASAEVIRRMLGISINDSLFLGNVTVVVEGDSEILALRRVLKALMKKRDIGFSYDDITFVQRGGASKIPPFVELVAQLGLPLVVVLDNDQEGRRAAQDIKKGIAAGYPISVSLVPLEGDRKEAEIEDVLPESLLIAETIK